MMFCHSHKAQLQIDLVLLLVGAAQRISGDPCPCDSYPTSEALRS